VTDQRPEVRAQQTSGSRSHKQKIISVAVGSLLFGICVSAEAQSQAKLAKIGWLGVFAPASSRIELFRRALRDVGYVEGKNIEITVRSANGRLDQLPALVGELVRLNVDVLVIPSTPGALAAKNATRTVPIVFIGSGDPVLAGLVDSLPRPGGNITGFSTIGAALAGKRLELLKETIPNLSRVAVLWNPRDPTTEQQWKESQLAARELGLQLHSIDVSRTDNYEDAMKEAIMAHMTAVAVTHSALFVSNQQTIADAATKNRLPAIYARGDYVVGGGLMSYGPDEAEPFRRAAVLVGKILKGTKPADLPVEQPTKFELIINLNTAKKIGLTMPPALLARADKVIK
jgi:putative tryptophan/tyrosine transport system substrate-binding protein